MEEQVMQMQMQQMGAGVVVGMIIFWVVFYVFFAFVLAKIANKLGMPLRKAFIWALIPIANIFLFLKIAAKPTWWFILFLIPIANIVAGILAWMAIAERRGKPGWWGILIVLLPFVNIILILILAFGKEGMATTRL